MLKFMQFRKEEFEGRRAFKILPTFQAFGRSFSNA
jgi:hypothetical protein